MSLLDIFKPAPPRLDHWSDADRLIWESLLKHRVFCRFCLDRSRRVGVKFTGDGVALVKVQCHGDEISVVLTGPIDEPLWVFKAPFNWHKYTFSP